MKNNCDMRKKLSEMYRESVVYRDLVELYQALSGKISGDSQYTNTDLKSHDNGFR